VRADLLAVRILSRKPGVAARQHVKPGGTCQRGRRFAQREDRRALVVGARDQRPAPQRRSRANSATPRFPSSALICWERDGAAMCRRGRTAEVQLLGDGHEVAQLAQFHRDAPYADC
jgi:hypothetical protein